ncbi:Peptide deformylase [Jannaschia seosinensis]|uniref:Peptide deformylase n=1 Tax=Jannaschia seosinensis TaxID=313367 RepID=A0A0M7BAL9_9RHOB|nr:peptide deformylase [Jannaschia seosinensis]CUH39229.1 Peptide deformylase [Jannaschia seosinensis]
MIRPIVIHPDPVLRDVCDAVTEEPVNDVVTLARDMLDTMYAAPGRGLAAPQVGVTLRLFVMDCSWKEGVPDPRVFVNPEIVARVGEQVNIEGCLSIPDTPRRVARPASVTLAFDGAGGRREERFAGFAAACICHEIDHLDGVLILDHPEAAA